MAQPKRTSRRVVGFATSNPFAPLDSVKDREPISLTAESLATEDSAIESPSTDGSETDGSEMDGSEMDGSETNGPETDGSTTDGSTTDDRETKDPTTDDSETQASPAGSSTKVKEELYDQTVKNLASNILAAEGPADARNLAKKFISVVSEIVADHDARSSTAKSSGATKSMDSPPAESAQMESALAQLSALTTKTEALETSMQKMLITGSGILCFCLAVCLSAFRIGTT